MAKVLIIYHSHTGNTEAMAKAVYEGASAAGATVTMKKAADTTGDDLLGCDAVAFGTPNYFNYMAGTMKDFFDRAWLTIQHSVKPYTTFGSAGSGRRPGSGRRKALDSIDRVCKDSKLKKAFKGVIAKDKPSSDVLEKCKELGKKLAQL